MTVELTKQLKDIVDGVARSGALTPDAIRQFDDLQKRTTELEAQLKKTASETSTGKPRQRLAPILHHLKSALWS